MAVVQSRNVLTLWKDVIYALILRQIQSKFNDKFGIAWLVVQPVIFIVALGTLRGRLDGGDVHGLPPFVFMLLGFVTVLQFIQSWSVVSMSIKRDTPLFAFRQVQPIASVISASLIELISFILVMVVLSFVAVFLGDGTSINDPLLLLLYMFEIQLIAYSLGLLFGVGMLFIPELQKVENMLQRPLIFISGTFFSLNDMPTESWPYLTWNPLLHGIELSRHAVHDKFPLAPPVNAEFLHLFTISILFLALATYFSLWKQGISR